jgi:hypothetical protein
MFLDSPEFRPKDADDPPPGEDSIMWDTEAEVVCPYCGEGVTIGLDPGGGPVQAYVEDCQVCCQPWRVSVRYDREGAALVEVDAE